MKKCNQCHTINEDSAKYCESCGDILPGNSEQVYCPHCGKLTYAESMYCQHCGVSLYSKGPRLEEMVEEKKSIPVSLIVAIILLLVVLAASYPVYMLMGNMQEKNECQKLCNAVAVHGDIQEYLYYDFDQNGEKELLALIPHGGKSDQQDLWFVTREIEPLLVNEEGHIQNFLKVNGRQFPVWQSGTTGNLCIYAVKDNQCNPVGKWHVEVTQDGVDGKIMIDQQEVTYHEVSNSFE